MSIVKIPGLSAPAEIIVDKWGVPHISAATAPDAFRVQGWNAARDRLWQIDLWRKRGLGLLSADFGPSYAAQDRASRLFLYRGDMDAEWACYGPHAKEWTEAFVGGINAFVADVLANPAKLPIEFQKMETKPALWQAEDVVRVRTHARVRNLEQEFLRTNVAIKFGLETDALRKKLEPAWTPTLPEGLTLHELPAEILAIYQLATNSVAFAGPATPAEAENEGSNNWALSPSRTTTGRPLLASDPHRQHDMPSLRYLAHLQAPGLNVIGAGEPCVPGVSLGHNERIAFGLTIFPTDQEDLYVYDLDPANLDRYRYGDGWEAMTVERPRLSVAGGPDQEVELRFTRHGPVLHVDKENHRAYALRTAWTAPGTAAYLASLNYIQASNWEEFLAAQKGWGAPSVNHVYADVDGGIGWVTAGFVPKRPNWDGLLPAPGDGRYEWAGFHPHEVMPRSHNPAKGWVATANQMNLPEDFDVAAHKLGFDWANDSRFRRIREQLDAKDKHSPEDVIALQTDFLSIPGRRLCALLLELTPSAASAAKAVKLLSRWDHRLDTKSAGGALFQIWYARHLAPATIDALTPPGARSRFGAVLDPAVIIEAHEAHDPKLAGLLDRTLAAAWDDATRLLGGDPQQWAWGTLHHGFFEHPLAKPLGMPDLSVGPLPKGGSELTVNCNGYRPEDFRVINGVSFRMVLDVGNWDAGLAINCPGQSGDPASAHYRDLFPIWANEGYFPLVYSKEAIARAAEKRIALEPA